jgi:hypothetical protein
MMVLYDETGTTVVVDGEDRPETYNAVHLVWLRDMILSGVTSNSIAADINGDMVIDARDLVALKKSLAEYGTTETPEGFVNVNDYYWKYGEEIVNVGVPGKEDWPPYTLSLTTFDFENQYCIDDYCFSYSDPAVSDIDALLNNSPEDEYARIYNNNLYSMAANDHYKYTYIENDTTITIEFNEYYSSGSIVFEKQGTDELVLTENTCPELSGISVGTVFEAYPRWEMMVN